MVNCVFINIYIQTKAFKVAENEYTVQVFNFHPELTDYKKIEAAINKVLSEAFPKATIASYNGNKSNIRVKFNGEIKSADFKNALSNVKINGEELVISSKQLLKKPALFVRKSEGIQEAVKNMLESAGASNVTMIHRTKDVLSGLVIGYFDSEDVAQEALKKFKGALIDNTKLSAYYK